MHFHLLGSFSLDWIVSPPPFFKTCGLQTGLVGFRGSQESRGLVIRVGAIDYKFCYGVGTTNRPIKLSGGKAQVAPMVWKIYDHLGFPMATVD